MEVPQQPMLQDLQKFTGSKQIQGTPFGGKAQRLVRCTQPSTNFTGHSQRLVFKNKGNYMNIDDTLNERGERYGDFRGHAEITQGIKNVMRAGENWNLLDDDQIEALDMIAHKIGRVVNGDPNYVDSWTDIIGYARLVEKRLIENEPEECTDPRCPTHNPEVRDAIEVLRKHGVIELGDE